MPYRFLEHMCDQLIEAWGKTLEEAFESAALAMFETMTDTKQIEEKEAREFKIQAEDLESLLYDFLTELLYYHDAENLIFKRFELSIRKNQTYELKCKAYGERFDPNRHESRYVVKAVTYHLMRISKEDDKWTLRVLLDL